MDTPAGEYLTTKELAELLRIKERKVYDLAASGELPCLRATGKLLFPRAEIDAWLARVGKATHTAPVRPNVILGSHDPLLDWSLRESGSGLASLFDGSLDGLERFARGEGLAAGLHLYQPRDDDWNTALVRSRFAAEPVVLMEFAWRERGLIVAPADGGAIDRLEDLRGRRLVPRQAGAGSQVLLEHLLAQAGIALAELEVTGSARTETDAAYAVLEGRADAAFGLSGLAARFGLGFVPLVRERFDLLVDRRSWFEGPMQRLLAFCRSPAFVAQATAYPGYDIGGLGSVHFNGA
jgi:excisionase family DNA binding protein